MYDAGLARVPSRINRVADLTNARAGQNQRACQKALASRA
jgi:hypothetical protein